MDLYLEHLAQTDPQALSRAGQMALYINAYNACTLKLILEHFEDGRPVRSIKSIGGFFTKPWDIRFCRVGGETYTLDEIEHDILRPVFKDPRVHFAVNCASRSCPPLISEPYREATLERQLDAGTTGSSMTPAATTWKTTSSTSAGSSNGLRKTFRGGSSLSFSATPGVISRERLSGAGDRISVRYLDYDWFLNGL